MEFLRIEKLKIQANRLNLDGKESIIRTSSGIEALTRYLSEESSKLTYKPLQDKILIIWIKNKRDKSSGNIAAIFQGSITQEKFKTRSFY